VTWDDDRLSGVGKNLEGGDRSLF